MTTLKIGDKAPDFKALDQEGNEIQLSNFKGKKLILFFYPKASTPGCTMEVKNLRDNYTEFLDKGYEILGVSADSAKRQQNFINKNELPFSLLADEDKSVIKAFGVWGLKKFMGREYDGIHRTTFVIDENGIISNIILKVKTKDHANQIFNFKEI
ncbi:MAG TPA: thioredoxin-dependent thiol peroxidase [Flavobacteriaceae bacterium]|nr:thioredoxin-dependent thiol peroxidase [Flavobacteriaceae bacterium]